MKLTEDELKELYQEASKGRARRASPKPSDDALVNAAAGTLDRSARGELADALADDASLAEEYRTLRSINSWAARAEAAPGNPAHAARSLRTWVRWGSAVAAAAAALMVAVLVFPLRTGSPPIGSDHEGSAGDASATRAVAPSGSPAAVALIEPGDMAVGVPKRFRWEPVGAANAYRLAVFKEDGKQVWSGPDQAGLQIDTADTLVLARGIYFWQVAALKDGRVVAASKLSQFQVR